MVAAPARRELVRWMGTRGLSERRSVAFIGMSASAFRYQPRPDRNVELRARIVALAQRHRRYGVEMIHLKLRQAGELVNYKRVERLYRLENLHIRRRRRKKIPVSERQPLIRPASANWLWSRPEALESVDVLFVDEAAQVSLANVLAVSHAAPSLVLLGDPRQLDQPTQGSHPDGTGVSAMEYLLNGRQTIGSEQGLFLGETWRLHPDICSFTSEVFYEGRLTARAGLNRQVIRSSGRIQGSGLRYLPVEHQGNQSSSPEEVAGIDTLVSDILCSRATWINREGAEKPVTLEDILIIAPYNAQVFELKARLRDARIGTVDKFQGQEAPIVIYSMTSSSHADAPRGMNFLYSLNRLNVATSRARCVSVLVASPALFEPECRTPDQMRMANAFCRYLEIASDINV